MGPCSTQVQLAEHRRMPLLSRLTLGKSRMDCFATFKSGVCWREWVFMSDQAKKDVRDRLGVRIEAKQLHKSQLYMVCWMARSFSVDRSLGKLARAKY